MKHLKTLLLTLSLLIVGGGSVLGQTQHDADNYEAAKAAITDGATYRIKTTVSGTDYYVTTSGSLTSSKDGAGYFTITKTSGGNYGTGFRINTGTERFTNPPLSNNVANLKPGSFSHSTNDRTDWERQILYLNSDGKYAIRSCNVADGTSSWNDAGRTHWTYYTVEDVPVPCYSYEAAYIWDFDGPLTTVNVTYKLVESDGTTQVNTTTVKQEANSSLISPLPGTGMNYNGFFHEKFYYDYTTSGTIGDTDCTITITRTEKSGVVKALTDLSNNKAYNVGCDRGAMIAYDGKMVNTALNNATVNAQPLGKFAILNYEDNYYIFSVDENKFIKNDASVALDLTAAGFSTDDAMVIEAKTTPYFLWHFNADGKYLNTNGNAPLGYVINSWSTADEGNQYYMVEAGDFDPTAALAELDAYFHPSYTVTYKVKDTYGNVIYTSDPQPTKAGNTITTLPSEFRLPYYTYNEVNVTISELETTVEFTATWNGPFKLSTDYEHAQWQNMAIRSTWYVTSEVKDGDGAYKTQNANTMGLVEDSYQWAFVGDGYKGFKVINKEEGDGKSFGWTDETQMNAGIPTIMDDEEGHHLWKIVPSTNTSVPANSFCLNVAGTDLYINQYGGAGGSLKFWDSGSNIGDAGSAFTVFDVPTNFASFVVDEITPSMDATGYFTFTDAAKASIGYDESKKTECSFEDYKSMKENMAAAMSDPSNFVLPETGYYRIKSAHYAGFYMTYTDRVIGSEKDAAESVSSIVKLTALDNNKYTITVGGLNATAPGQSVKVGLARSSDEFTVVVSSPGVAAFTTGTQYGALHSANSQKYNDGNGYYVVGWTSDAGASQWMVEDATINSISATISDAGYATLNALWPVTIPSGVKVYTATTDGTSLTLNEVTTTIPAATPVILEGNTGTYEFKFTDDVAAIEDNNLVGTYTQIAAPNGSYILQKQDKVGFYQVDTDVAQPNIPANRAYLTVPASDGESVKAFYLGDMETAIKSVFDGIANGDIYDLNGRKVQKLQKGGLYIVNGKKVIVK